MVRLRHYTRRSSRDKILTDGEIVARDQNKVFVEYGNADPYSPRDAEQRYGLKYGKGNAFVEFDAEEIEVESQVNRLTGRTEYFIRGTVDLTDRNPTGHDNI